VKKLLVAIVALLAALAAPMVPSLRRYLKIEKM
jgi:hypothetical protein